MNKRAPVVTVAVIATIGIVVACGGKVYGNPIGYLDDGGVFHAADGAISFGPSSACSGYDSATFTQLLPGPQCVKDEDCRSWTSLAPPGYATDPFCLRGYCEAYFANLRWSSNEADHTLYCTPGPEGDAYCAAFFQQFLVGDAHVWSTCQHECVMVNPENASPYCQEGTDYSACVTGVVGSNCACADTALATFELCVYRGDAGTASCEAPCSLPPTATVPDGGSDE